MATRQPIVSVLGHVDHGKTSILDRVRGSKVASRESGAITQHIGASEMPLDAIREVCGPLMKGKEFRVPGLLFIDTPGHHAFTTLRARGGALADIAIVVVDVNEGFKPQTKEAVNILRKSRTPFVVAANKIDRIHGWNSTEDSPFVLSIRKQSGKVKDVLDEKLYEVIGNLTDLGVPSADRYDRVGDFTKSVAVVPVSAKTGEGISDLLLMLVGLAQRFLEKALETQTSNRGRGTVLEVKEERGLGLTMDAIIYDGTIRAGDTIVVGAHGEPRVTKVKGLFKPKPKDEMRDHREPFSSVKVVEAASGVKISAQNLEGVLAGAPLLVATDEDIEEVTAEIALSLRVKIETEDDGVYIKADTIGSLEALASECRDKKIPIKRAEVGDVSRRDVIEAATIQNPLHKSLLAFNVGILPDAKDALAAKDTDVALFESDIIYTLLDDYEAWVKRRRDELERERRLEITFPGKIEILPDHIYRVSKPAIVGVRVHSGRIRVGQRFLRDDGRIVGEIKSIRRGEESVKEARQGEEVALAIDDVTIGRQMDKGDMLYVDMPEGDAKKLLRGDWLNYDERDTLEAVAKIRRKESPFWGM